MVVADTTFQQLKVNHLNDANAVIDAALQVPVAIPNIMDRIETMKRVELPEVAQLAIAKSAASLRWGDIEKAPIEPRLLLNPRRSADSSNDLWTTFNRVQENVIKGGQSYYDRKNFKRARVREVKGIDQNTALNKALWHVAEAVREHFSQSA